MKEYFNLLSDSSSNSIVSLSCLFNVSSLTLDSKNAFCPADLTFTDVLVEYPIPAFTISTSVIWPFSTIGLSLPPAPSPVGSITLRSGEEKYSWPT